MQGMLLVNWDVLRGAVYFAGRGVNKSLNTIGESRLAQVESPSDVRVDVTVRGAIGVGNRNQRSKMKYHINIFQKAQTKMTVSNIAGHHLDLVQGRNVLQPTPEIERIVLGQGRYVRSSGQKVFDQVRADEAVSPRHKHSFALQVHLAGAYKTLQPVVVKPILRFKVLGFESCVLGFEF